MHTIEFDLAYPVGTDAALDAFWRAERWPGLTPHVTGIEILYEDPASQVLRMSVETRGSHASFRTMRCLQRNRIYYFQPSPPPFLRTHGGWWQFDAVPTGCTVTSHHAFEVEPEQAVRFATEVLGWDGQGDVSRRIGELLASNSRQTMLALRDALAQPAAAEA